jgi:hypothetical protein
LPINVCVPWVFFVRRSLIVSLFNRYRLFIQSSCSPVGFSRLCVWRNVHFICCWIYGQKWLTPPYDPFNSYSAVMFFQLYLMLVICIFSLVSLEIYELTLFLFLAVLGLTSGPHTCWAGGLPLDPLHQPCLVLRSFHDRVSRTIFPELTSNHNLPDFCFLSH